MSRLPREPLDAGERALAAALPRAPGRQEPGPALDAAILSAARAATGPGRSRRPRRSWIVPTSLAASVTLALGLAWRLQPPAAGNDAFARSQAEAAAVAADPPLAAIEAPASPTASPTVTPIVAAEQEADIAFDSAAGAAPASEPAPPRRSERVVEAPAEPAPTPTAGSELAKALPAPPPPPPPPSVPPAAAAAPARAAPAPAAAAAMADTVVTQARASGRQADLAAPSAFPTPAAPAPGNPQPAQAEARAREPASQAAGQARPAAAMTARAAKAEQPAPQRDEAERAANAIADTPDDDVPPATMDAPAAREAWLQRILELQRQGRLDEARASLAEFRRRHPAAKVPTALDTLKTPQPLPDPPPAQ